MRIFLLVLTITLGFTGCRSKIKQQEDSIYSRHLQRHVALTIITTPMPKDKEEMNLLLFNGGKDMRDAVRAKKIIDSLYKKKLIQPLTLVAFDANEKDYGLQETGTDESNQHQKLNDFVTDELYPFIKKRVVIRKFNSVAICGFGRSALSAFDIAWNNDEKIQKAGMFYPNFRESAQMSDNPVIETIRASRKRPNLGIWLADAANDPADLMFKEVIAGKKTVADFRVTDDPTISNSKTMLQVNNFADFLIWAFPK